jgi:type IV secretion system protein VirD4
MQCTKTKGTSIVVTDPKGTLIVETGKLLVAAGYEVRAFNTINFSNITEYGSQYECFLH